MRDSINRRGFIKSAGMAGAGITFLGSAVPVFGQNAPSDKLRVAVMGTNGRGLALTEELARLSGVEVAYICDVDDRAVTKGIETVTASQAQKKKPKGIKDFRRALDDQSVDALVIAAPDHWHMPASVLALSAGKHVYVEKPCGHNPREGEMLIDAQKKYGKVVQMGNQQRSAPETMRAVQEIKDGLIGTPYFAKAWYANTRESIGRGQKAAVPAWLDYELWQGPAPREDYRDNLIHYNWHWFWNWGTGELCNNGTHEIDIARWALGVDYPIRVSSQGGRYHYDDDWEFYDTQVASFDFEGEKTITWEGRSCNGRTVEGRGRGTAIYGTDGTIVMDRDGYEVYDQKNQLVKEVKAGEKAASMDTRGGDQMTAFHLDNFAKAVKSGEKQNSPIEEGHKSVLLCHLGNIAQKTGHGLICDPSNGHIKDNQEAMQMWGRKYAPNWEPKV